MAGKRISRLPIAFAEQGAGRSPSALASRCWSEQQRRDQYNRSNLTLPFFNSILGEKVMPTEKPAKIFAVIEK